MGNLLTCPCVEEKLMMEPSQRAAAIRMQKEIQQLNLRVEELEAELS